MSAPRLKTLAAAINRHCKGYTATVERGFCSTDRKYKGSRIRYPGKGRYGNRLIVRDRSGKVVFDHNSAEPYRRNYEAESWVARKWGRIWEPKP